MKYAKNPTVQNHIRRMFAAGMTRKGLRKHYGIERDEVNAILRKPTSIDWRANKERVKRVKEAWAAIREGQPYEVVAGNYPLDEYQRAEMRNWCDARG